MEPKYEVWAFQFGLEETFKTEGRVEFRIVTHEFAEKNCYKEAAKLCLDKKDILNVLPVEAEAFMTSNFRPGQNFLCAYSAKLSHWGDWQLCITPVNNCIFASEDWDLNEKKARTNDGFKSWGLKMDIVEHIFKSCKEQMEILLKNWKKENAAEAKFLEELRLIRGRVHKFENESF